MERYREELTRIRNLLRVHPRGLTVTDIARHIGVNRNSVAKYLDVLITSGHVEKKAVGPAKVFFLSPRVPVSAMLNLSSDYIIMVDENRKIWYVNNSLLSFEGRTREEVLGRELDEVPLLLLQDPEIQRRLSRGAAEGEVSLEIQVKKGEEMHHFRATLVCTILEDGGRGTTVILEDITEGKRHEESLRASEERFRSIAERAFDIILLIDETGRITYASPAVMQSAGYNPEEVIGKPFFEFIPSVDQPRAVQSFDRVRQGMPPVGIEVGVKRKDGSLGTLEIRTTPLLKEGRFTGVQAICRDITDRKASEEALRKSEEKFRNLFEAMADGICLADERGTIIEANRAMADISGIPREEGIGRPIWEIAHRMLAPENAPPDFLGAMRSDFKEFLGTGRFHGLPEISEHPVKRPDGTRLTIQVRNFLIPLAKGYRMGSIIRDITDRKQMEDELKGMTWNLGERVKELQCLYSISRLLSSPDLPFATFLQGVCDTLPTGMQKPDSCGARIRMEGQECRSAGFAETPWRLSQEIQGNGGPSGSIDVCYTSDISAAGGDLFLEEEEKLLEEVALRLAETRMRHRIDEVRSRLAFIVESADDAIIGKDLEGNILSWNRGAERIYGYPAAEVLGKPISLLRPPGYPDDIPSILEKIRGGERVENYETRRRRRDGTVIPVSLTVSPVRDSTGAVTGVSTFARDISEQKETSTALTEQVHLVRELLDRIPVPVFYKDAGGTYLGCNHAFEELSGLSRDRIIGCQVSDLWPPGMADHYRGIDRQILESGQVHHDEVDYPAPGEESRTLIFTRAPFYRADRSIGGIVGIVTEITHLRRAEQALRHSEEQFREMAEISPFPIAIIDGAGRYRYLNRRFTDVFGYTLDDVPDGMRWFELAYPDPRERSRAMSAWKDDLAAFGVGMVRPRQFRVRCRNGEYREVFFRPVTMRDGNQFLTYQDLTDQIRTLNTLTRSESLYRHLFNTMRCCFTLVEPVLDPSGKPVDLSFVEVNAALERLAGRPREVLIGKRLRELYPRTPEEIIQAIATVAVTGKARKLTMYHPDLDRHLSIRAYSPAKGQCALIFRTVTPAGQPGDPPVLPPPRDREETILHEHPGL